MTPSTRKNQNESAAAEIVLKLKQAGFEAYFVGGCVRDMLLNKQPSDFDVATSALPDQVEALFPKTIPVGKSFGVIIVQIKGAAIEVATFREDLGYTDGRRPTDIRFSSAKEDALRRDFTINGLYYDVERKKVVDWVGGQKDLELKIIRTIGDPFKRFEEDKLRMLRAVRFSANLDFPIEAETLQAIQTMKDKIVCVSMERVRDELVKMFCGNNPDKGLMLLHESGLFEALYPEAALMSRCSVTLPEGATSTGVQLLTNIFKLLKNSPSVVFFAALIRFVVSQHQREEKNYTAESWLSSISYTAHEAAEADQICEKMRLSNDEKKMIGRILKNMELFYHSAGMSLADKKRLLRQKGIENDLLLFSVEEKLFVHSQRTTEALRQQLAKWSDSDLFPEQHLSGDDLIKMGLTAGPELGRALFEIETLQLENKLLNKDQIVDWVSKKYLT